MMADTIEDDASYLYLSVKQVCMYTGGIQKVVRLIQMDIINFLGWLEEQDQQFFYSGIQALEKRWTKCISVAAMQQT